ncbi:putative HHT1-histone H3 [Powellomyces hirtus]|nr:putative HHT1-histone H3 [Powellomyces hirtus]
MARTKNGLRITGFEPTTLAKTVESQTRTATAGKQPRTLPACRRIVRNTPKLKATRRKRKQTAWLREVKQYQKSTDLLICKLPFQRTVREIVADITLTPIRWQSSTLLALQQTAEAYLVAMFGKANKVAIYAGRMTIKPVDLNLVRAFEK